MAKLFVIIALFACVAVSLAAEKAAEAEKKDGDLQTASSFYGGLGYGAYGAYGYGYPLYGGLAFPYFGYGYGYRGYYPGYGGYGFYG